MAAITGALSCVTNEVGPHGLGTVDEQPYRRPRDEISGRQRGKGVGYG